MPQISKFASEGLSCREISEKVGVGKTTVALWLHEVQQVGTPPQPRDPAQRIREKIEDYTLMRDELLEAWRRSQADKEVRVVEKTGPAAEPGPTKKKRSIRHETRTGDVDYMDRVIKAQEKIDELDQRLAAMEQTDVGVGGSDFLANLTEDDLQKLTDDDLESFTDDQLFALEARLVAKYGLTGPPLTAEDLHNMTDEQLIALEREALDQIEQCGRAPESR
ncbi:MAG: hypothetical protein ACLP9L_32970 [Thermoguttaceae bacterium]